MASLNDFVESKIDAVLQGVRPQFEQLFSFPEDKRKNMQQQLAERISSESKILLHAVINLLIEECLKRPEFASAKKRNIIWQRNFTQEILSHYVFSYTKNIKDTNTSSLTIPIVTASSVAVLGGTLALALDLDLVIIVPIAIVTTIVAYFFAKKCVEDRKRQSQSELIEECLADLKTQLMEWLHSVEAYFHNEIDKIEKSEE